MKVYLPCRHPDVSDMKFNTFSFSITLHPIFRFIIEEKDAVIRFAAGYGIDIPDAPEKY